GTPRPSAQRGEPGAHPDRPCPPGADPCGFSPDPLRRSFRRLAFAFQHTLSGRILLPRDPRRLSRRHHSTGRSLRHQVIQSISIDRIAPPVSALPIISSPSQVLDSSFPLPHHHPLDAGGDGGRDPAPSPATAPPPLHPLNQLGPAPAPMAAPSRQTARAADPVPESSPYPRHCRPIRARNHRAPAWPPLRHPVEPAPRPLPPPPPVPSQSHCPGPP